MLSDESPSPVHEENESLTLATAEILSAHIEKDVELPPSFDHTNFSYLIC